MIREMAELCALMRNRRLAPDELRALQDAKVRQLAAHAFTNVPYYRSLFQSAGITPGDIRTAEDLKRIPITLKEDLRKTGPERLMAQGKSTQSNLEIKTSGSTGMPFTVYLTRSEQRNRQLIEFRSLISVGFRPWDRLSVLGPEHPHQHKLHQRLGFFRSENISVFLPMEEQVRRLERMRPTVLWGYPTVLRALLHQEGARLSATLHPRIIITSAQGLDEVLKNRIRETWKDARWFDLYGAAEFGRIAYECPQHRGLHVNADHVIIEIARDSPAAETGEHGSVILTALNAYRMPFIRYRLGDVVKWADTACDCVGAFPLIDHVHGREDELVKLPGGQLLSSFGLQCVLRRFAGIDQFRFIQEGPQLLELQLAVRENFPQENLRQIETALLQYLGHPFRINIQILPFLNSDRKYKTFICRVP